MARGLVGLFAGVLAMAAAASGNAEAAGAQRQPAPAAETSGSSEQALLTRYCITCHNDRLKTGGLSLDSLDVSNVGEHAEVWEKVVRKLRAGVMPPVGRRRPEAATSDQFVTWLEAALDNAWASAPDPGRTETLHRLNRAEYRNAIRDLLGLDLDIVDFLPADDSGYGFDNIAGSLRMSHSLMDRYLTVARTISRMAVGSPPPAVDSAVYRIAQDMQQQHRVEELPFGTRGGLLLEHVFPQDAEYDIRVEVAGDRGLPQPHQLEITIDGEQVRLFRFGEWALEPASEAGPRTGTTAVVYVTDGNYELRVPVGAGPREVGVTFYKKPTPLVEQILEVFENPLVSGTPGRGGRMPRVTNVAITGPYNATGSGDTPSRRRVFVCRPATEAGEGPCARTILSTLARRAYRGHLVDENVEVLLGFYEAGRADGGGFEDGVELALRRLLISPEFLYRIEADPGDSLAATTPSVYRLDDLALASRLSFFLWSSIPDDELLDLAEQGRLSGPDELERQARRMLADPKSVALTENFAGQWLQLRNLVTTVRPGHPYGLAFDESLRQSMLRETELFVDSIIRENRSLIELLTADYTFLNERLGRHYGLPHVNGSRFRRVTLPDGSPRRGLLGHGSVLTLTSHAIRTSPVNRGKWILDNVLGTPPPDPPANVPALDDRRTQTKKATLRERMFQHRANPVCASCHNVIDPAGFALEHYDAVGRWRDVDESFNPIDASGSLPDGTPFDGGAELTAALVRRPERFVTTVTEKLLTYALGRGLEHFDMPALRKIVKGAVSDDYSSHAIVLGIVHSYPFLNRRVDGPVGVDASAAPVAPATR